MGFVDDVKRGATRIVEVTSGRFAKNKLYEYKGKWYSDEARDGESVCKKFKFNEKEFTFDCSVDNTGKKMRVKHESMSGCVIKENQWTWVSRKETDLDLVGFVDDVKRYRTGIAEVKSGRLVKNKLYQYNGKWYSPDWARHGDSVYKRFEFNGKKFTLICSVDKYGKDMDAKHESMSGFVIKENEWIWKEKPKEEK